MKSQADFPISLSQAYGPVRAIDLALYAAASGDHNPLHLDEQVASEVGFEKPVVHGMLSMAFLARMLSSHFGVGAIVHLHTRFTGIALRGQTLQFQAKLEQVVDQVAHYQLSVSNKNGAGVIEGLAQIKRLT